MFDPVVPKPPVLHVHTDQLVFDFPLVCASPLCAGEYDMLSKHLQVILDWISLLIHGTPCFLDQPTDLQLPRCSSLSSLAASSRLISSACQTCSTSTSSSDLFLGLLFQLSLILSALSTLKVPPVSSRKGFWETAKFAAWHQTWAPHSN